MNNNHKHFVYNSSSYNWICNITTPTTSTLNSDDSNNDDDYQCCFVLFNLKTDETPQSSNDCNDYDIENNRQSDTLMPTLQPTQCMNELYSFCLFIVHV